MPYPSIGHYRKSLAEPSAEGAFNLVACVDNEVIGHLGLYTFPNKPRRRHVGQVGMAVRDDWRSKSAGTALMQAALDMADRWLNLQRIELEVYTDNEPALRLYKKFGFNIEGVMIRYAYRDGQFVDGYMMARRRNT